MPAPFNQGDNRLADAIEIGMYFFVRNAQDAIAICFQGLLSSSVVRQLLLGRVCGAVDFDDKPMLSAQKVRKKCPNRLLPHEFVSAKPPSPQLRPKALLRRCLVLPQFSGAKGFV